VFQHPAGIFGVHCGIRYRVHQAHSLGGLLSRDAPDSLNTVIGAAIGTGIGAIAGGGKGAAIGAGIGAGAGTAAQVFTKGKQVQVPSETKLDFTLEEPVQVTIQPGKSKVR
jgi:hypothetical protein